jgi:hypothetical protein
MARQVTGTTSQYLNVVTPTALPYPFTYSAYFKYPLTTAGVSIAYGEAYPAWDAEYLTSATSTQNAGYGKGSSFNSAVYTHPTAIPAGWHLVVCVYVSASERRVYLDNSSQTALDTSVAPFIGHTAKNLTIGGVLVGATTLHTPAGFNGEVADVALWNTALSASEVDALAAGRPGDVQAASLQAWYKLGEDGSLASSVGSYGPLVEFGSCPVTTDPPYPGGPVATPGTYVYRPDYSRDNVELDTNNALLRECVGYFPLIPSRPYWNPMRPDVPIIRRTDYGYTTIPSLSGSDNSTRFTGQKLSVDATKMPMAPGYPWSVTMGAWIKVHSFASASTFLGIIGGDNATYFEPFNGTGPRLFVYGPNQNLYVSSQATFNQAIASPAGSIHLNEWMHVAGCFECIFHGVRYGNAYLWINGKLVASVENNAGLGVENAVTNYTVSIGSVTWYPEFPTREAIFNGEIRDAFYYRRKLSDNEVRQHYEQGDDLYIQRTPRLYFIPGLVGLQALPAEYDYAGLPATLRPGRGLLGARGSYALSGLPVITRSTRILPSLSGSYSLSGKPVALALMRYLQANPGGFILAGEAATLVLKRGLLASYGVYTLDGMEVDLLYKVPSVGGGRIFYVLREDRTLRIIRDKDVEG